MPELPEVETVRRGLAPHLEGQIVETAIVRDRRLRWPIPRNLVRMVSGRSVRSLGRRGKYLLVDCGGGWLILHLGMSGSLRLLPREATPGKHDHFDLVLGSGMAVRLTDPRRFGAVLWCTENPSGHPLLSALAPEPLEADFDAAWLHAHTRGRSAAIKTVLMDSHTVVGVGNIYASESLFRAGINPRTAAGRLSIQRCQRLVDAIKSVLEEAIAAGGSTLRDFVGAGGEPGHFQQAHFVYGRDGQACLLCSGRVRMLRQGQRATYYCPSCQRG